MTPAKTEPVGASLATPSDKTPPAVQTPPAASAYRIQSGVASDAPTRLAQSPPPAPPAHPLRKTDNLHHGRLTFPHARYFVTLVTHNRARWLVDGNAQHALDVLRAGHDAREWHITAATCMPDHMHVLFRLGEKHTVGQCVGRWKFQTRHASHDAAANQWQRDFWEHRLRPEDESEKYGFYIFLNPYRARLVDCAKPWPWTWFPNYDHFAFSEHLGANRTPPPEWLQKYDDTYFESIHVHE